MLACTPAISDGETQGMLGMRYSLISRDYIADCIEVMHEGYAADAMITLGGCDKTVPGVLIPLARLNHVRRRRDPNPRWIRTHAPEAI